jgi:hypothetical protein
MTRVNILNGIEGICGNFGRYSPIKKSLAHVRLMAVSGELRNVL